MKALVIFDSTFGNTKTIAMTIAEELGEDAKAVMVSELDLNELKDANLVIVGSPINGWQPSEKIGNFLENLGADELKGIKAAAFDTRLKIIISGNAANKIAKGLKKAGAEMIIEPQMFYVKGSEGPLIDGMIEKAKEWAKMIKALL